MQSILGTLALPEDTYFNRYLKSISDIVVEHDESLGIK